MTSLILAAWWGITQKSALTFSADILQRMDGIQKKKKIKKCIYANQQ